jgi:hypothetical protein
MKMLILITLSALLIGGCGVKEHQLPQRSSEINARGNLTKTPLTLNKNKLECKENINLDASEIKLFLYQSGESNLFIKDLSSENIPTSKVISSISYDEEVEFLISDKKIDENLIKTPKELKLCLNIDAIKKNSVESAALNISYFIQKTYEKFRNSTHIHLPPIKLRISPKIKQTFVTSSGRDSYYLTDNAFYYPDSQTMTFLPQSSESRMTTLQMSFWEIPMVPSHEYGHHIFNTLFGYSNLQHQADFIKTSSSRKITVKEVLNALNEGFSDLIAYYSLDRDESDLTGVPCLEYSRDVAHGIFANGTPKIFTQKAIHTFFFTQKLKKKTHCEEINFQDIHTFGAIFAHNADQFLSLFTDSPQKKVQILTTWVLLLKKNYPEWSKLPPRKYFDRVFEIFLRITLLNFDKTFDRSICDEIEHIYPIFYKNFGECS